MTGAQAAVEVLIRGVVQGVGFRPFVHRLALRFRLDGWVRNEAGAVRIMVQGSTGSLADFLQALRVEDPPLARIDFFEAREIPPGGWCNFRVVQSDKGGSGHLPISPDVAVCRLCLAELSDPGNRRYRYPFITCTDCGPRFTVIEAMPYDRERTSMADFPQCPECRAEYRDPRNRRYHSETNSCATCGPQIWLEGLDGTVTEGTDRVLGEASDLLRKGWILAVRGLGGFHLAVDACHEGAVTRLKERKGREGKPLAIVAGDPEEVRTIGRMRKGEESLLLSAERPIVLLEKNPQSPLAPSIAPGLDRVGVMLAYTPLHHLLLAEVGGPLVMTSGNLSEEPIATGNSEARERLAGIADAFLYHDREIVALCDDSVVQAVRGAPVFLRRARGYAPLPVLLPSPTPVPTLAVGPHLKNTFALAQEGWAYLSPHIGDLESLETLQHFRESLNRFRKLFRIDPEIIVRDLHPGYLSTRLAYELAEKLGGREVMAVQHHHAHVAAVLAEHGETGPAVGLAFDGTGYGDDGHVWGGEVLVADLASYRRVGRLRYSPLPGGEAAVRQPWRTAAGYLSLEPERGGSFGLAFRGIPAGDRDIVAAQARRGMNAPLASSMGRLFDAAAAVIGLRRRCDYEGQAAMELEAAARRNGTQPGEAIPQRPVRDECSFPFERDHEGVRVMDPLPLLGSLGKNAQLGVPVAQLAAGFHWALARTASALAREVCGEEGLTTVVLGGGVFQNALLLTLIRRRLEEQGLRVLGPRALSPNDGAVSFGQVAVAAARLRMRVGATEKVRIHPSRSPAGCRGGE